MATRRLLAELTAQFEATSSHRVSLESIGGVDAAKRVKAGDTFDLVVLAKDAIEDLTAASRIVAGSRIDVAVSAIAIAVPAGTPHPDISSAGGVKRAVLSARSIGYSTGPSGVYLAKLFKTWDSEDRLQSRITVAPAGIPVGSLGGGGEIAAGFSTIERVDRRRRDRGRGAVATGDPGDHHILRRHRADVDAAGCRTRAARIHDRAGAHPNQA